MKTNKSGEYIFSIFNFSMIRMRLLDKLVVLTVGFFTLLGCAQQPKESKITTTLPTAVEYINAANIVDYLAAQVKPYNKQPIYAIRPIQNNCIFEILVNDLPIYREFTLEKLATPLVINDRILKSGPQTITYRLYPIGDLMVQEYGTEETISTLRKNTSMKIEVIQYEDSKLGERLSDEIVIARHTSPIDNQTDAFVAAGLTYYEYTFTFNATVPYNNEGWSNGEDLKKFDKEELEKIVVEKNLLIGKLYKEKKLDSLVKIEHINKLIYGIANYRTKEEFQGIFDQYKADVFKEKEIQSMEGYQMEFYGENRIVTLRYSILKSPDPRLKGQPALYYLYKDEYGTLVDFLSIYLFLPKGKPLTVENLQIL
ncbi:hypothetical protein [Cellulophaga sp. HaHa_2_1]|uniref:hypothetical protein n=2 Tax=unclassified Cellulophaga TaxID=2634405 RepID=UPI001C4EF6CC|nr:hypothetical protein [Cellulophaga sp. HaHa_2_1]QXP52953.1 hypothetical protein H0I24_03230 [Cellulophaga sp. HaHa_2_1]